MPDTPYRVVLINMPFAHLGMPSIALTQLAAELERAHGDAVAVETLYLNLDFVAFMGDLSLYNHTHTGTALMTGIGEWFFRQAAFPDAPDNAEAYYARYYFGDDAETRALREAFEEKRAGLEAFLDALIDRYDLLGADLVGFTTLFTQTVASFALARRIKDRRADVLTVIGGASCDSVLGMEIAEHVPQIDAVFSGPALKSFPAFVGHLKAGDSTAGGRLPGVFTRDNVAGVHEAEAEGRAVLWGAEADINTCVPLEYDGFLEAFHATFPDGSMIPTLLFETSRGCWWAEKAVCSFCGLNGVQKKQRAMTPDHAIAHIESLYRYVDRCRVFMGVDTILPKGYTEHVFPKLSPPEEMVMFYELKADVSKEDIACLVASGVRAFQPGIESLSTATLKLMRKGTTAFQNILFLRHCAEHPVRIDWNLLAFSPGEDEAVYEKALVDMAHLHHLAPPTGAYPISFERFSRYFDAPDEFGLSLAPQDYYGLTYPFDEASVANMAYHFRDKNADTEHIDAWLDRLNAAVQHWSTRWLGQDGQPQARLCLLQDDGPLTVYDSRSGRESYVELTDEEMRLLERLEKPQAVNRLKDEFGEATDGMLDRFRAQGWVFEENRRLVSLVIV